MLINETCAGEIRSLLLKCLECKFDVRKWKQSIHHLPHAPSYRNLYLAYTHRRSCSVVFPYLNRCGCFDTKAMQIHSIVLAVDRQPLPAASLPAWNEINFV